MKDKIMIFNCFILTIHKILQVLIIATLIEATTLFSGIPTRVYIRMDYPAFHNIAHFANVQQHN